MKVESFNNTSWKKGRIKKDQINKYCKGSSDFIRDESIIDTLNRNHSPDKKKIIDILAKSRSIATLSMDETAALLNVNQPDMLSQMKESAAIVKKKIYDNRIVTFAPLYLGNHCINDCLYCGFRHSNKDIERAALSTDEILSETQTLAGSIGHKRLIVVYGEHPLNDIDYMVDSIKSIYGVKVPTKRGYGQIRRVNVNAPALSIEELKRLAGCGIGTYQIFQETYHHQTYSKIHPQRTVKGNYKWRLYAVHRAFEASIDDVGLGALFGLYDWKFEVLALAAHNIELEKTFGVGAHTISFPRLLPAINTPFTTNAAFKVSDEDFMKIILVLRLCVPHTGLIITARENAEIRRKSLSLGITQTDASTRIGIGSYSKETSSQVASKQQFILGDTRSLDELIMEFAELGYITSFCTAGYRCQRTGKCIMELLRECQEAKFCKLNAVLTFREWLDDFASEKTLLAGEKIINKEIDEIKKSLPDYYQRFKLYYERIKRGERDLYF
ncbi:MAG: [FeFe] hydrogenase H-cluster radical SAM maturase HydG [Candidatus Omnitrophota bacterium]